MKLEEVFIGNFRSIQEVSFKITEVQGSYTYSLIGINEAGKSSLLKAISLVDDEEKLHFPRDYHDKNVPITVEMRYFVEENELVDLKNLLKSKGFDNTLISKLELCGVIIKVSYSADSNSVRTRTEEVKFRKSIFEEYTLSEGRPVKKTTEEEGEQESFNISSYFSSNFPDYFWKMSHRVIFWKSDSKHLINEQIHLEAFAGDPENVSIPLLNCFRLAGIQEEDIRDRISVIKSDTAEVNNLQERLGDTVTSHIKKIWPKHPISIRFQIDNMFISFLVEDDGVKYKTKTPGQRSDGFRQFISFLLTVSAESETKQLSNSFLLLDEPETHLHPQAQESLKRELINITQNNSNNIVIFATHSNYMVDKSNTERCYRVSKHSNSATKLEQFKSGRKSYAEVNYEVFGVLSIDFFNELYSVLYGDFVTSKEGKKMAPSLLQFDDEYLKQKQKLVQKYPYKGKPNSVTLLTYIRNCIHYPNSDWYKKGYKDSELKNAIELMKGYI